VPGSLRPCPVSTHTIRATPSGTPCFSSPATDAALAGFVLSYAYTAPPLRLKKIGLGEPDVLVVWGPLMVGGTYFSATGSVPWQVLVASVPYGLLCTTVLMGKHVDKIPYDAPSGTNTLPVLSYYTAFSNYDMSTGATGARWLPPATGCAPGRGWIGTIRVGDLPWLERSGAARSVSGCSTCP